MVSRLEEALALIDRRADDQIAFLKALVAVPSDNPPGDCAPHAAAAKAQLEAMGFAVEAHAVPEDVVREHGMISATNLIVRHRFGDGPTVALNAHGDVVPPGEGWTADPYGGEIRDGWLYGRGAAVSKSDFATYAWALRALVDADISLAGAVELHFTYDEETGGTIGPAWILAEGLSQPDYAICASFSYEVVTAHNGCLHLEVAVAGKSAHAARPDTGHDALEASVRILNALYAYRDTLGERRSRFEGIDRPSLVVGLIEGGINTNVVPDRTIFRLDRRILPEENPEAVEAEIEEIVRDAASPLEGISVSIRRILLARPFVPVAGAEGLAEIVSRHATTIMAEPVRPAAVPLYADARHYAEAGIPTVMYGAGPRTLLEANGHRADERVPVDTLSRASKVITLTLADLLQP